MSFKGDFPSKTDTGLAADPDSPRMMGKESNRQPSPLYQIWLARAEFALTITAVPLLLFPRSFLPWVGIGFLLLGALFRGLMTGRGFIRTPLDLPVIILLAMTFISLYPSSDLTLSMPKFFGIVLGVFVYYWTVNNVKQERYFWTVITLLIGSVIAISAIGLVSTEWSANKYPFMRPLYDLFPRLFRDVETSVGRVPGFNPNELGGTLAFLLPLPIALLIRMHLTIFRKIALGLITLLGMGVLFLSVSRSAFVAITTASLILLIWRWRRVGLLLILFSLVAIGLVFIQDRQTVVDFLLRVDAGSTASAITPLAGRFEIWDRAINMIEDYPFTGIGLNMFLNMIQRLYPLFTVAPDTVIPHAHNIILQTTVDLGLGGLLGFVGLSVSIAYTGWQALQMASIPRTSRKGNLPIGYHVYNMQAAVVGLMVGLLSYLIFGLMDAITLGAKPVVALWLMMGLLVAAERILESSHGHPALPMSSWERLFEIKRAERPKRLAFLVLSVAIWMYWLTALFLVALGYLVVGLNYFSWGA